MHKLTDSRKDLGQALARLATAFIFARREKRVSLFSQAFPSFSAGPIASSRVFCCSHPPPPHPPTRASRARTRPIGSLLQLEVGGSEGAEVLDRLPLLSQVAHARMHSLIKQGTSSRRPRQHDDLLECHLARRPSGRRHRAGGMMLATTSRRPACDSGEGTWGEEGPEAATVERGHGVKRGQKKNGGGRTKRPERRVDWHDGAPARLGRPAWAAGGRLGRAPRRESERPPRRRYRLPSSRVVWSAQAASLAFEPCSGAAPFFFRLTKPTLFF